MKHIILMGFMGCGKSTVGYKLSYKLSKILLDTDSLIEQKEGMTISNIFAMKGEEYFRECEVSCLKELKNEAEGCVISLGGGTPLREVNRPLIKELGTVIYLKATPDTIHKRTKNNTKRPLLQCDNPKERIEQLLKQRNPIYESLADAVVYVDGKQIHEVVNYILEEVLHENIGN